MSKAGDLACWIKGGIGRRFERGAVLFFINGVRPGGRPLFENAVPLLYMEIPLLYESPEFLAISKPNGLVVERDPHGYPSVEEWAGKLWPFVGIVHRLDRPVSGVLLLAKKKSALRNLNRQFEAKTVVKIYLAIAEHTPSSPEGILEHWLIKDQKGKKALVAEPSAQGAFLCKLNYRVLQTLPNGLSLLEIRPQTGKFHQIRAQLSAAGCPIVGDEKYGAVLPYLANGIALHAWQLHFADPATGESLQLKAPGPVHSLWTDFDYLSAHI